MGEKKDFLNDWYLDLQRQEITLYQELTAFLMDFQVLMKISMKNWKRY